MYSLAFLAVISFLLALLITPVVRDTFRRLGLVDRPNDRKLHRHPIPRVGGVAILLAYAAAFGCVLLVHSQADRKIVHGLEFVMRLAPPLSSFSPSALSMTSGGSGPGRSSAARSLRR